MELLPELSLRSLLLYGIPLLFSLRLVYNRHRKGLKIPLNGKAIVVTGADSGIGLGVVTHMISQKASSEAKIIALCLTEEGKVKALAAGAHKAFVVDLTVASAVETTVDAIHALCKAEALSLFAVVHNAGIVKAGFLDFQTMTSFRKTMEINFFAIVQLNALLMPAIKRNKGRVVIVTSVDGIVSLPGNAPYDCSKFAAEAFADALRVEMSSWDINVSVINPSTMRTPLALGFFASQQITWNEKEKEDPSGFWKLEYSQEWLDAHIKANTPGLEQIAEDPIIAVKDICHALTAKHPQHRYLSGGAANSIFWLLWCMPESWSTQVKKAIINPKPNVLTEEQIEKAQANQDASHKQPSK